MPLGTGNSVICPDGVKRSILSAKYSVTIVCGPFMRRDREFVDLPGGRDPSHGVDGPVGALHEPDAASGGRRDGSFRHRLLCRGARPFAGRRQPRDPSGRRRAVGVAFAADCDGAGNGAGPPSRPTVRSVRPGRQSPSILGRSKAFRRSGAKPNRRSSRRVPARDFPLPSIRAGFGDLRRCRRRGSRDAPSNATPKQAQLLNPPLLPSSSSHSEEDRGHTGSFDSGKTDRRLGARVARRNV